MDPKEFREIAENYTKKFVGKIFPGNIRKIENAICVCCENKIDGFKNIISKREYEISGLCQNCQDGIFEVNKGRNKCSDCGDEAEYQCIENQEKYCRNCKILMNVNGAGMEIDDYHFKKVEKVI